MEHSTEHVIETRHLTKEFLGFVAVNDVNLKVKRHTIHAIIGPNGAGKSTLLKSIFGLVKVRGGGIRLRGDEITGLKANELVSRGVGYVPQNNNVFPSLSIEENLQMGLFQKPEDYSDRLEFVTDIFKELGQRLKQKAGSLSGGERQMVAFIQYWSY